jgi:nucleotide-binding universal stress UspA family protein
VTEEAVMTTLPHPGSIVVGVDGSKDSQLAIEWAAEEAQRFHVPLHLLHATDDANEGGTAMRALVVYESMFGNTRDVAQAIGAGLGDRMSTSVCECSAAPTTIPPDVDVLVVGAPTHAFGLPRASTRVSAQEKTAAPLVSQGLGLREWLAAMSFDRAALPAVAAFDTRVKVPRLPGSAAAKALRQLRRAGATAAQRPRTFSVLGMTGPLAEGELAAARQWGSDLAAAVAGGTSSATVGAP